MRVEARPYWTLSSEGEPVGRWDYRLAAGPLGDLVFRRFEAELYGCDSSVTLPRSASNRTVTSMADANQARADATTVPWLSGPVRVDNEWLVNP
jgi:hypothetical protein